MRTKFVEVTNGPRNWGKFCVARFDEEEWARSSAVHVGEYSLVAGRGWTPEHVLVLDLQTGEGAIFLPGGHARNDLEKHQVWVCPMFEPFLAWLYQQPDPMEVPDHVDLPDAEFSFRGHRRPGPPDDDMVELVRAVREQCAQAVAGCHYTEDTPDAGDDVRELDASLLLRRARAAVAAIHAPTSNVVSCDVHDDVVDVEFGDGFSVSLPCSVFGVPADARVVGCEARSYGVDLELEPPRDKSLSYSSNWIRHQASLLPGGYNYLPGELPC